MPSEINRNSFILSIMLLLFTACEVNHPSNVDGVEINGVIWAKANVDSPGTFASTPESDGLFYQWNKKIGWSTTNPLISTNGDVIWDKMPDTGDKWVRSKDPSPVGWRIPTVEDFESLLDNSRVKREWINQNGVKGYRFTDIMTGNSIFLLECGYRDGDGGRLSKNGFIIGQVQSILNHLHVILMVICHLLIIVEQASRFGALQNNFYYSKI